MKRAAAVDNNQALIVKQLRQIPGISVAVTHRLGQGFPDIVVGHRGRNYLIELKAGDKVASKKKLTPDEVAFHESWNGQVAVCENLNQVLAVLAIN